VVLAFVVLWFVRWWCGGGVRFLGVGWGLFFGGFSCGLFGVAVGLCLILLAELLEIGLFGGWVFNGVGWGVCWVGGGCGLLMAAGFWWFVLDLVLVLLFWVWSVAF